MLFIVMKQIFLGALMLITAYAAHSQNQFSDYVSYLKDKEGMIQMPDPKVIQRPEFHLFPKPIEVKKTHNKVIVVFDRKEFERFRYLQQKRWQHPDEVRKQREWLEHRREFWNKQKQEKKD